MASNLIFIIWYYFFFFPVVLSLTVFISHHLFVPIYSLITFHYYYITHHPTEQHLLSANSYITANHSCVVIALGCHVVIISPVQKKTQVFLPSLLNSSDVESRIILCTIAPVIQSVLQRNPLCMKPTVFSPASMPCISPLCRRV